jgi:hypothetical protein
VNLYVGSNSVIGAELVNQLNAAIATLFLETAENDDLDRYVWDRYRETRKAASPAYGVVRFYRDVATAGAGSVPLGTKVGTKTGIEYVTTTVATFDTTDTVAYANVRSTQAGKAQQAGQNAIRRILNPALLWDPSLKVNNDAATAHANDRELDSVFRERVRDFWLSARRGTLSAISYGARRVPGIYSASAIEALTTDAQPARVVNLFLADESGIASQAISQSVLAELMEWRAGGIAVIPYTCNVQMQKITYKLQFIAGVETAPVVDKIRAVTAEKVNTLGGNETLMRSMLFSILEMYKGAGLIPSQDSIVEPAGDIVPATGYTIRTDLTNVTVL